MSTDVHEILKAQPGLLHLCHMLEGISEKSGGRMIMTEWPCLVYPDGRPNRQPCPSLFLLYPDTCPEYDCDLLNELLTVSFYLTISAYQKDEIADLNNWAFSIAAALTEQIQNGIAEDIHIKKNSHAYN